MSDILLIIVLYRQRFLESVTIQSLISNQTDENEEIDLLVYDNSPNDFIQEKVEEQKYCNIKYIRDPSNAGVSHAYNIGCKYAQSLGKKRILLLDQDTMFPNNALKKYKEAICLSGTTANIIAPLLCSSAGYLSPSIYRFYRAHISKKYQLGVNLLRRKTLLNSGLLISIDLFERVGGYNENIKLDFADVDFIERVKKIEPTFWLIDVKCKHSLSSEEKDKEKILDRFNFYCFGAKEYIKKSSFGALLWLHFWIFLRTIKLSITLHDISFFKRLIKILYA
jgi:GT2 family glycosyltransferase